MKRLFSSPRGRKMLLDFLPAEVCALTLDLGDHRLTVAANDLIGRHVFAHGGFARESVGTVCRILDENGLLAPVDNTLLEIGANIGTQTVYFGMTRRFGRIVAIEPDPDNLALLRQNVAQNGLTDRTFIFPCAAGDEAGTLALRRVQGNSGNASLVHPEAVGNDVVMVAVRPVGDILADAGIDAASISLVWMDIEGYEPVAIRSMSGLLERKVPIFLEYSPESYGADQVLAFTALLGRHYSRCIIFDAGGSGGREAAPRDLPMIRKQCDVLMLP